MIFEVTNDNNEGTRAELGPMHMKMYVSLHGQSIMMLKDLYFVEGNKECLIESEYLTRKRMKSDLDLLVEELKSEIARAKTMRKNKFPVRSRWEYLKVVVKNPLRFTYGLFKIKFQGK
jgi:hypothetical protein